MAGAILADDSLSNRGKFNTHSYLTLALVFQLNGWSSARIAFTYAIAVLSLA